MTKASRFTMRVEPELLEKIKEIAKRRGTTVSHLVDQHFRGLVEQDARALTEADLGVEQV